MSGDARRVINSRVASSPHAGIATHVILDTENSRAGSREILYPLGAMNPTVGSEAGATALPKHLPALDGLRGIAILLVLAHNFGFLDHPTGPLGRDTSFAFSTGWIGVQLFFVLSGFLITGILLDTNGASNYLSAFFSRRVLRIFPLYYGTLFLAFVVWPALGTLPPRFAHDQPHQIWLWTYLSNWVSPLPSGSEALPHYWSLGVEEQFYLVWPFLMRGRAPAGALRLSLAVAVASFVTRVALHAAGVSSGAIYTFTVTRMDALAAGAAAAAAIRVPALAARLSERRRRLAVEAGVLGLIGAAATHEYARDTVAGMTIGYSFLAVAFALWVLSAAISEVAPARGSWLRWAPLRAFGKYSYAMYVFHKPLHDLVGKRLVARFGLDVQSSAPIAVVYVVVGVFATFVVALASYHLFERHFLALKARFEPRRA
jgi:peptidoglycan/LPS O-acetylase OafA/YrhL